MNQLSITYGDIAKEFHSAINTLYWGLIDLEEALELWSDEDFRAGYDEALYKPENFTKLQCI